ncbi:MAG: hypothetical protein ABSE59_08225 [Opitutaceae bacterium]|jgi:hypothetical protein
MELQYLVAKIFTEGDLKIDPTRVVNVFHRWVAQQCRPELLVDVAELLHVPAGPGVVLVGVEADYALDHTAHRWGLLYRRKTPLAGTNGDRLGQALRSAGQVAKLLEDEFPGELTFSRREFSLVVNDRALAPNTPEAFAAAKPEVEAFLQSWLGRGDSTLEPLDADLRRRFGMLVKTARPFELAAN